MLSITFRVTLQLSDKQYEWTALSARAKIKQWRGLEQMFTAKVCIWFNKRYSLMRQSNAFLRQSGLFKSVDVLVLFQ